MDLNYFFRRIPRGMKTGSGRFVKGVTAVALLLLMTVSASAQVVQLANESFKKSLPQGWSVYPASTPTAPTWASDTHVAATGKYAMHGYVPYNAGDTVELVSPFYDCTSYKHVQLKFKHICKVLGSDLCQIYYRENYLGSEWQPIPGDAYEGESVTYMKKVSFSDMSYNEWKSNDTFAMAQNTWWKNEIFDMSDLAGYSTIRFKFVIKKGNNFSSFIADGWYLDDFCLLGSNSTIPIIKDPKITFLTKLSDTIFSEGPYPFQVNIVSRSESPITQSFFTYTIIYNNTESKDTLLLAAISDSIWAGCIPKQKYGSVITYTLSAMDSSNNVSEVTDTFYVKKPSYSKSSVALVSINSPIKYAYRHKSYPLSVSIKNMSESNALRSCSIGWSVNNVIQPSFQWNGSLQSTSFFSGSYSTGSANAGTYYPSSAKNDTLKVWVSHPNGSLDSITSDDTLVLIIQIRDSLLSGTYTVGNGNYDFQTLVDATDNISQIGMGGNINLLIADGTYKGNVIFHQLTSNYNIRVTSISGNADKVIICSDTASTLVLSASKNMIFENLTFVTDSVGQHVVEFSGDCDHIYFRNCNFVGRKDLENNSSDYAVFIATRGNSYPYYQSNVYLDDIKIIGSRIENGTYAFYLSMDNSSQIVIDSNIIDKFCYAPIDMRHVKNVSFCHNSMKENDIHYNDCIGAIFFWCDSIRVEGNSFLYDGPYAGGKTGLRIGAEKAVVCNNEIVIKGSNSCLGIYLDSDSGSHIVNNSVYIYSTSTASNVEKNGIECQYTSNKKHVIRNNIVVVDSSTIGSGLKIASSGLLSTFDVDYNVFAASYAANIDNVKMNLSDMNSLLKSNHNSSKYPVFSDTNMNTLQLNHYDSLYCPVYPLVDVDKNGMIRFAKTGRGCYVPATASNNAALVEVLGYPSSTYKGDVLNPSVVFQNAGIKPLTDAQIQWKINDVLQTPIKWIGNLQTGEKDTIALDTCIANHVGSGCLKIWLVAKSATDITMDDTLEKNTYTCLSSLSGTYTVGDTGFFSTLEEAVDILHNCGLGGNVTLKLIPGIYTTHTIIPLLNGMEKGYGLTVTSLTGDSSSVILLKDSIQAANGLSAPVIIDSAQNVTISYLTLRDTFATHGSAHAVAITGTASNNKIEHCCLELSEKIEGGAWSGNIANALFVEDAKSVNYSIVYVGGPSVKNISVTGNAMKGGVCGFYVTGTANHASFIQMSHNNIKEIDYAAFHMTLADSCYFRYNNVIQRQNTDSKVGCVVLTNNANDIYIEGNVLSMSNVSYGIISYSSSGRCQINVINNEIKGKIGRAIHIPQGTSMRIYHNTIHTTGASAICTQFPAIMQPSMLPRFAIGPTEIVNNIFHINGSYTIDLSPNGFQASYMSARSNCYYLENNGTNGLYRTLSMDSKSVCIKPDYLNDSIDFSLANNVGLTCEPIKVGGGILVVPTDIAGLTRDVVTTMGAHETFYTNDVALQEFVGIHNSMATGTNPVGVIIQNRGRNIIDSAIIRLYINKTLSTSFLYHPQNPLGGYGKTDTVWLGNFTFQRGFCELMACVESADDTLSYDDTAFYHGYMCVSSLSGTYSVGDSGAYFPTFEAMHAALYDCGINGPVEFRIRSGKYGPLVFDQRIPGCDSTNTVTFISDSGIVVFDGDSTSAGMILKDMAYITFKGLTFGNKVKGVSGVKLEGDCESITIRECNIYACTTATANSYKAVDYTNANASGKFPRNVKLVNNNIIGGYYNVYLYYLSSGRGNTSSSLFLDSNMLTDACRYGIYTYAQASIPSVSHNRINKTNSNTVENGEYYGIYSYETSEYGRIEGNVIQIRNNGTSYGMCFYRPQSGGICCNNDIRVSGRGIKYGIYEQCRLSPLNLLHNSILVSSEDSTAYGIYLVDYQVRNYNSSIGYYDSYGVVARNIVVAKGMEQYPLYVDKSSTYYTYYYKSRMYNNWYSSDNVAYVIDSAYATIVSLIEATQYDSNSISVYPSFKDTTLNLELNDYSVVSCPSTDEVMYDLYGNKRKDITAMGAYANKMYGSVNLQMEEILYPKFEDDVVCMLPYAPVIIAFGNTYYKEHNLADNPLEIHLDVTGPITYHFDTVISSGTLASGMIDTMTLGSVPVMESGTYHIMVTLKDSADVYPEDDTLSTNYTVNWINPPYDVNFTTTPAELISVNPSGNIGWNVVSGTGVTPAVAPAFGTGRLEFAGAGNPGASANAVFNGVNLKGCLNPTLSFWYAHDADDSKRDLMFVLATTDGGASYTEIGRITAAAAATGWRQYDIDLSRFANEPCLSIVFQAISFGGANQSLDRIRITADADAALTLLPVDFTAFTACENDAVPLKVVVSNLTAMPVEYSSDTIRATVTGASNQSYTFVYSRQLAGYETDTVTMGSMDLRANGNYYINVSMQSQDDNALNDTASDSTILIRQDIALDSIVGIDAQTQHPGGDTVYVSALVRNNCNMAVDRFTVTMELNGETVVTDTVLRHMEAGDSIVHAMSVPYVVPFGTKEQPYYFLELSAVLPCDADAANDARSVVGVISVPDTVDLQVLSIARPSTDSGRVKVSPKVTVANVGNAEVRTVMLHVDVLDSSSAQLETVSEYINFINVSDTMDYAFSLTYTVPNYDGSYYLKAYADTYANEINTANDTLTAKFACKRNSTGIVSHTAADWSVGQNEPNPANATTVIPFVIPEDAEVALTIMGVNGQLLHREIVAATAGANRVTLQTGTLPSGLYYYGVEYKGQRIVRKMNVVR